MSIVNDIGDELVKLAETLTGDDLCQAEIETVTATRNAIFALSTKRLDEEMTPLETRISALEKALARACDGWARDVRRLPSDTGVQVRDEIAACRALLSAAGKGEDGR